MRKTNEAIKNLIDTQLNNNPDGIIFDTTLYNSKKISYEEDFDDEVGYGVTTKKVVPAHIVEIVGNYINIPNTSAIETSIGIEFDMFVRDYTTLPYQDQELYKSVDYENTEDAIQTMQQSLLAQRFTLGDVGLMFGGTDSTAHFEIDTAMMFPTIYLKMDLKTNRDENLFYADRFTSQFIKIDKDDTNITLSVDTLTNSIQLSLPYELGVNEITCFYDAQNNWNLSVNGTNTLIADASTQSFFADADISRSMDFNGILYQLLIDDSIITLADVESGISNVITEPLIDFKDFTSRYELNQDGSLVLTNNTVDSCLTWGTLGNIVFGVETLVPIDNVRYNDNGYPRQLFGLGLSALISEDILFGNDTEYKISFDGGTTTYDIFPLDRQHTFGTELSTEQYINSAYAKSIVGENMKDLTKTFFFKPNYELQKLFKHITSDNVEQNEIYQVIVQFPFHKETYNVVIDSGGAPTNLNQLQTLTVTFKQKDDSLT